MLLQLIDPTIDNQSLQMESFNLLWQKFSRIENTLKMEGTSPFRNEYLAMLDQKIKSQDNTHQIPWEHFQLCSFFQYMHNQYSSLHESILYLIETKYQIYQRTPQTQVELVHKHYVSLLPQDFSYHPLFWMKEVETFHPQIHKSLKPIFLQMQNFIQILIKIIYKQYFSQSFLSFLIGKGKQGVYEKYISSFVQSNLQWACLVLITREFSGSNLIPLLDLFNHSQLRRNAEWKFDNHRQIVSLRASKQIKRGDQILVSYGDRSSQSLFKIYGFVMQQEGWKVTVPSSFYQDDQFCIKIQEWNKSAQQIREQLASFIGQKTKQKKNFKKVFQLKCDIQIGRRKSKIEAIKKQLKKRRKYELNKMDDKVEKRQALLLMLKLINQKEEQLLKIIVQQLSNLNK